jgi:ATP-dependent DNA helicase RecG
VINAVAHRDYFEKGANVMVEVFDHRIEITNPGGLVKGLRPEDFGTKSVLRNPNIAALLHRVDYIEKMGTGINKIRLLLKEAKLPPPQFEFGTFFTVRFERPTSDDAKAIPENFSVNFGANYGLKGKKLERVVKLLQMFYNGQIITAPQAAILFKATKRTIENDIEFLRKHHLIDFVGSLKTGKYILTKGGKKLIEKLMK